MENVARLHLNMFNSSDMFITCSILGREVGLHKVFNYREKKGE